MSSVSNVVSYKQGMDEEPDHPSQLPDPTGFRILVAPKQVDEKTGGGIVIPEERKDKESDASIVYCVLKLGPDAYDDKRKFPNSPWCEEGDWVILPSYAGIKFFVEGMEFRIINDDTVHAVIEDPRTVARA